MEALAVSFAFLAASGWILVAFIAVENGRLRRAIDKADDNDGRDAETGRYVGRA